MFKGSLEGIPNFWQNMDLPYRHFTPPKPLLSEVIIEQRLHSIPQAPNEPTNPTLEKVNSPIDIIFSKEYNSGDMITDDFTTVEETASLLGFTVQHTRLLIRQGQLKGTKIGREWIIEKESIRTLLSQRNTEPMITERKRGRPPKALIVQRRVS